MRSLAKMCSDVCERSKEEHKRQFARYKQDNSKLTQEIETQRTQIECLRSTIESHDQTIDAQKKMLEDTNNKIQSQKKLLDEQGVELQSHCKLALSFMDECLDEGSEAAPSKDTQKARFFAAKSKIFSIDQKYVI